MANASNNIKIPLECNILGTFNDSSEIFRVVNSEIKNDCLILNILINESTPTQHED